MHAGVVKSNYRKEVLDQATKEYQDTVVPAVAAHEGGRSAMLLVNRATGDAISIVVYDDEESAKAFTPKASS